MLLVAGFSVGGTEVVAVTAGESNNPQKSMPKAIKQVFWRILLFYVLSIAVIAAIIPYTDPLLLKNTNLFLKVRLQSYLIGLALRLRHYFNFIVISCELWYLYNE